jgi:hypothetical protein
MQSAHTGGVCWHVELRDGCEHAWWTLQVGFGYMYGSLEVVVVSPMYCLLASLRSLQISPCHRVTVPSCDRAIV